ncbi:hypothetical protein [Marseilla massiliensis]|uniref:Uncharacterized protein n=2 Tax=Bacteria TaxID=2 RepID=A0A938WTH5_9BACT|nr:hypothetical protein [Marseilla massiliensis]MBM6672859.1 hypothetical protein [Marseilla massiliensis]
MLKTKSVILSILLLMAGVQSHAQVKNKRAKGKPKTEMTAQQEAAQELYETMLLSTAQVMFIDSIVVDSADFISRIPLNRESGRIGTTAGITGDTGLAGGAAYINEFGNRIYFSTVGNDGRYALYSTDKLGGEWTAARLIDEFGNEFEDVSYPYMMADGVTLYFAAKGKESLGGYDIYVTRYDTDSARFYRPENVGLPYNSTANDYYCAIDEFDNIGWLVTDRHQPAGKVCIYTFVPADTRTAYDVDAIGDEMLRSLADIRCITDTWTDNAKLQAARNRVKNLQTRNTDISTNRISFVVNDNTVYNDINDFKSPTNRERFGKLQQMKTTARNMDEKLEALRRTYSTSNATKKKRLADNIMTAEKQLEHLDAQIHEMEKEIRNAENLSM